jgi:diadenylate cyclase
MVMRIADEIRGYIVDLGVDGRLVRLQLDEQLGTIEDDRRLVVLDYSSADEGQSLGAVMTALGALDTDELLDLRAIATAVHPDGEAADLEAAVQPRGFRLLSKIPRLPEPVIESVVERFGTLHKIMRATIDDLVDVEGVGTARARAIKDGLSRLAESSILDRYS